MKFLQYILFVLIAFSILPVPAGAEVAVIPYKIINPSTFFSVKNGAEYSKLLSVAAIVQKGLEVCSPQGINADVERRNIDPQGTVTEEQLYLFGKSRYIDHILIGSLFRKGGRYISESLLYSVKNRKVLVTARVSDDDLSGLAGKEIQQIFTQYPDVRHGAPGKPVDIVFVVDSSYNMMRDWAAVKRGILRFSSVMTDHWSIRAGIHLVPFSKKSGQNRAARNLKTAYGLTRSLKRIRPAGSGSMGDCGRAIRQAVNTTRWHRGASKVIVLISNSPCTRSRYLENNAYMARRKKISLYTVSLGDVNSAGRGVLKDIAEIGNGDHFNAAYHQRVFDVKGRPVDLFLEGGRLFESNSLSGKWKQGLFHYAGRGHNKRSRPRSFVREIFYNASRHRVLPYSLKKHYSIIAGKRIINARAPESNIPELMSRIAETHFSRGRRNGNTHREGRSIARVLLENGRTSLWINVRHERDLRFFRKKLRSGFLFPLGVVVERNASAPFGITLRPEQYVTGISRDYIPKMMMASLEKLVQSPERYTGRGLFSPPLWFVEVKVGKIRGARDRRDIRE